MFNGVSPSPLSGAAHLSCQKGLLYCSARQGLCCFMTFQSESMIEISICFSRELTTGLELREWVARSLEELIGAHMDGSLNAVSPWSYSLKLSLFIPKSWCWRMGIETNLHDQNAFLPTLLNTVIIDCFFLFLPIRNTRDLEGADFQSRSRVGMWPRPVQ